MTEQADLKARAEELGERLMQANTWQREDLVSLSFQAASAFDALLSRITDLEAERDAERAISASQKRIAEKHHAEAVAAESRLALAEKVVEAGRKILGADREALADHRPKWGIADCLDNAGKPYQSQWFADTLRALSAALTAFAENTSSNDLTTGEDDA